MDAERKQVKSLSVQKIEEEAWFDWDPDEGREVELLMQMSLETLQQAYGAEEGHIWS